MNFLAAGRLWLALPVLALALAYVILQRRRRRYAVRFTNLDLLDTVAPRRPGWRRHATAALAGLAALAIVVGLARPVAAMEVPTEDAVVVLAIDTSMSMNATDVTPTRIAAAVTEARAFVESLPDGFEVGLVAFDRTARVLATPTTDHDAVIAAIDALDTGRGTAAGDAIATAVTTVEAALATTDDPTVADAVADTSSTPAATVVMLSDGATTAGLDVLDAARQAAEADIPVSTITYGTADGTVTVDGEVAQVPPDTDTMAQVADITGGTAFEAATADDLAAVYDDIEARIGTTTEDRELTLWFVAAGFAALLAAATAAFAWTGRFL